MDSVAPEIVKEVGVLLENLHAATGTREQEAGHHARRPAANYNQVAI